jgi:hypothetical protein
VTERQKEGGKSVLEQILRKEVLITYQSQSQSHISTDSSSVSPSWLRDPFGTHGYVFASLDFLFCLSWGVLHIGGTGPPFNGSQSLCRMSSFTAFTFS